LWNGLAGKREPNKARSESGSIKMSNSGSIGFGLTTSAAWGTSNFLGGYASRRANPFLLSTISHLSALAFLVALVATLQPHVPSKHALIWSLLAGTTGGVALAILYGSLSSGRMGLASPVVALFSVGLPATVTIVREGSPGVPRLTGFALAILGISLIGRTEDKTEKRVLGMAVLAGCGFASYSLAIKQAGTGSPMWIEMSSRLAAFFITAAISLSRRKQRGFQPRAWTCAALAGLLDVTGSLAFIRASQLGRLDMTVALSSLYPAVTVLLAVVLLQEKLTPWKAVGVCAALIAIPLIVG
jgi:drug/metabolite transporter (DMT)-like permease